MYLKYQYDKNYIIDRYDEVSYKLIGTSSNIVIGSGASKITILSGNPLLHKTGCIYVFTSRDMKFKLTSPNADYFRFRFVKDNTPMLSGVYQQFGGITSLSGGTLPSGTVANDYLLMISGDGIYIVRGAGLLGTNMGTAEWTLSGSIIFCT